jgi:hypothetical protein
MFVESARKEPCPPIPDKISGLFRERLQTTQEFLQQTLGSNEQIIEQFEVYYDNSSGMSASQRWALIVLTCGLYLVAEFCNKIYKMCCCIPDDIQFKRHVMIITTLGRVIIWKQFFDQHMEAGGNNNGKAQAPGLHYTIENSSKTFRVQDIRQMRMHYSQHDTLEFICCGEKKKHHEATIKLSFHSFHTESDKTDLVRATPVSTFVSKISQLFFYMMNTNSNFSRLHGTTVHVVSTEEDIIHKSNEQSFDDLNSVQEKLIKAMRVQPSFAGQASSKNHFAKAFADATVVDANGKVEIPADCLPLVEGEHIIAAQGVEYKMNFSDWYNSIVSCGCYYYSVVKVRRFNRMAILLTNCRLVSVLIRAPNGKVPASREDFEYETNSYFPGQVMGGKVSCDGNSFIESTILCDGGCLSLYFKNYDIFWRTALNWFPKTCPITPLSEDVLYFAKSFQDCLSKSQPLSLSLKEFVRKDRTTATKNAMDNVGGLMGGLVGVGMKAAMQGETVESLNEHLKEFDSKRKIFSDKEKTYLPLRENEKLVNRFAASNSVLPCCKWGEIYCCPDRHSKCCATYCSCGVRPYITTDYSVVTSHAIYHFAPVKTYPWSCFKSMVPPEDANFVYAWAPIRALKSQSFTYDANGLLPSMLESTMPTGLAGPNLDTELHESAVYAGCGGGKSDADNGSSTYDFQIHLNGGFKFHYYFDSPFANWIDHDELNYERYVFNELELKLMDLENGDSAPGVQVMERQKGDGSWW